MPRRSSPDASPEGLDTLALEIGKEIERARTLKKVSISELHRQTGISRTVLQGYEAGRYKPGAREIRLLAEALGCSPNRLLFGRENFKEPMNALVGDMDSAVLTTQLGVMFQVLTQEEKRALVNLIALMAEARVGGRDELSKALNATRTVIEALEGGAVGEPDKDGNVTLNVTKLVEKLEDEGPKPPAAKKRK
jgi:transcriptional regulator with XRE-family HTH domain